MVINNKVIGEGIESGKTSGDLTNHAEILAVRNAVKNGFQENLSKSIMYTTHEPCIMCSYLIRHHKISHIIYGTSVDFIGGYTSPFGILSTEKVPKWGNKPKVTKGVFQTECEQLTERFQKILK